MEKNCIINYGCYSDSVEIYEYYDYELKKRFDFVQYDYVYDYDLTIFCLFICVYDYEYNYALEFKRRLVERRWSSIKCTSS